MYIYLNQIGWHPITWWYYVSFKQVYIFLKCLIKIFNMYFIILLVKGFDCSWINNIKLISDDKYLWYNLFKTFLFCITISSVNKNLCTYRMWYRPTRRLVVPEWKTDDGYTWAWYRWCHVGVQYGTVLGAPTRFPVQYIVPGEGNIGLLETNTHTFYLSSKMKYKHLQWLHS